MVYEWAMTEGGRGWWRGEGSGSERIGLYHQKQINGWINSSFQSVTKRSTKKLAVSRCFRFQRVAKLIKFITENSSSGNERCEQPAFDGQMDGRRMESRPIVALLNTVVRMTAKTPRAKYFTAQQDCSYETDRPTDRYS